ncbi:hypothetical protein U1Q18_050700 [Sarracenia purpurea var. burkii]
MMQQFNISAASLPDPIMPTNGNRTQLVEIPDPSFSSTPKKQAAVSTSYVELNIRSDWPKAQSSQPTASSQFGENSQRGDWPKAQSSQPTASSQFGENSQRGDWPKAQSSQPTASSQFGENSQRADWPKAQSSQPTASSQFGENFQRGDWHSNQPITYSQNGKKFQRSDWSNSNSNQPTATSQNGANSQRCDWPKAQSSQPTASSQFGANFQRSDWPNFKSNEPIATSQNGENSQRGDWPSNQPIASSQNGENFQRGDWPKAQSSQPTASSQYGENFQRGDWSNFKSNESTASSQHGENNVPSQVPERWRNCQEPRLAEDSPRYSYAEALKTNNSPAAKAATRTYTPTRIFTPTKNRIANNSPGKAVNTSIANQIMASWYNQPDRRDRCSPNARRWPLENRSYLHPSPIPTRRFSDGNRRKVLNVEPDEDATASRVDSTSIFFATHCVSFSFVDRQRTAADMASARIGLCTECNRPLFEIPEHDDEHGKIVAAAPCGHLYHASCFYSIFTTTGSPSRVEISRPCSEIECRGELSRNRALTIRPRVSDVRVDVSVTDAEACMSSLQEQLRISRAESAELLSQLNNSEFAVRDMTSRLLRANSAADSWRNDYQRLLITVQRHNPELANINFDIRNDDRANRVAQLDIIQNVPAINQQPPDFRRDSDLSAGQRMRGVVQQEAVPMEDIQPFLNRRRTSTGRAAGPAGCGSG